MSMTFEDLDAWKKSRELVNAVYKITREPALARDFGIDQTTGFVISDHSCLSQAFWHQGDMTHDHALHYLQKYASADIVIRGTEIVTTTRVSYYPSQGTSIPTRSFSSGSC